MKTSVNLSILALFFISGSFISGCSDNSTNPTTNNPPPPVINDSVVILVSPPNNAVFIIPDTIIFTWRKTLNSSSYHIQFSGDSTFIAPIGAIYSDTTAGYELFPYVPPGSRFWRVRIHNTVNPSPHWSEIRKFIYHN